jgi:hypothetical protein
VKLEPDKKDQTVKIEKGDNQIEFCYTLKNGELTLKKVGNREVSLTLKVNNIEYPLFFKPGTSMLKDIVMDKTDKKDFDEKNGEVTIRFKFLAPDQSFCVGVNKEPLTVERGKDKDIYTVKVKFTPDLAKVRKKLEELEKTRKKVEEELSEYGYWLLYEMYKGIKNDEGDIDIFIKQYKTRSKNKKIKNSDFDKKFGEKEKHVLKTFQEFYEKNKYMITVEVDKRPKTLEGINAEIARCDKIISDWENFKLDVFKYKYEFYTGDHNDCIGTYQKSEK